MTIYATIESLLAEGPGPESSGATTKPTDWALISASGILQGGNPYFVPDFAGRFEARLALAVRIGKLGKGIAPRFAGRYVEAVAPCVLFVGADLLEELRKAGLPWTRAISYDRCLALGRFEKTEGTAPGPKGIAMEIADSEGIEAAVRIEADPLDCDNVEAIGLLSRDNTLKTGDILLLDMSREAMRVSPGQSVRLTMNGETSLRFNIR